MPEGPHQRRHHRGHAARAADHVQRVLTFLLLLAGGCQFGGEDTSAGPWVLSSSPADGAREVDPGVRVQVRLDRALQPSSVHRGNVKLTSGSQQPVGFVGLEPVTRTIFVELAEGQPLVESAVYELSVDGLVDLDGRSQPRPYRALFRTGVGADAGGVTRLRPEVGWESAGPLLVRACADAECHGGDAPAAGLDLASAGGVARTAIGARARQSPPGATAAEGARGALSLSALDIIDVAAGAGRPEASYLMYKVLGDPHVMGEPMPPGGPLSEAELLLLSDWIRGGAALD